MDGAIITTYRCNAKCDMCHVWKFPSKKEEEISPDVIEKIPSNLDHLNITGGEPMLRSDIEEIVGLVYNKARCVEVSTNGYFTNKIVRLGEKFPGLKIRVSIEGLPVLNDRLRGLKDGFDHALRTILELKKRGIKDIGFAVVIRDKNVSDLLNLYCLCANLGVELSSAPMHNSFYFHKNDNVIDDIDYTIKEVKKFITAMLQSPRRSFRMRIKDWLRAYFNFGIIPYITNDISPLQGCPAGRDMFFISPYGDVLPCNGSAEPWAMGNLKKSSFEEIWNSSKAEEVRAKVESCERKCWMMGTTRGKMRRNPTKVLSWIFRNKVNLALYKKPIFS